MSNYKSIKQEILHASKADDDQIAVNSIESKDYNPMSDILEMFQDSNGLGELELLLSYTNAYKLELEDEINQKRKKYRDLLNDNNDQSNQLDNMDGDVDLLLNSFESMKELAEITGNTINGMTANIKKLDSCKKNLTLSMATLQKLQMLVTAYEELEKKVENETEVKNYESIKQLLGAVLELMEFFQTYKSIDEINTLNKMISSLKNKLIDDIFNDFEKERAGKLINDQLIEACNILSMLGEAYKEKLTNWYINTVLKDITQIFRSTEEAGSLENLKRRYIYFQNILANFESKHLKVFPKNWDMVLKLTESFCHYTRKDLKEVTSKETRLNGDHVDVNLLLNSLSETLNFELFLNKKFKYYKEFDEKDNDNSDNDSNNNKSVRHPGKIDFTKSISDVFEPYLNIWIEHQGSVIENKFTEFLNPTNMFKKTGIEDENGNTNSEESINVLESAADLFRLFRQLLLQLSKLSNGKPLIKLSKIFGKYLSLYQQKILEIMLPDSKTIISADLKDQEEGVDIICLVLNTADYCSMTVTQLEEKIKSLIEPKELGEKVQFENSKNGFLKLINYCINLLFYKLENDLQISWRELLNNNWKVLNEVIGESRYVLSVKSTIEENCKIIFNKLSRIIYVRNFIDKLIEVLLNDLLINIIKLQPISVIMAEQFKLDTQNFKTFINSLTKLAEGGEKILNSNSFKNNLNNKFNQIDSLLKILMVPTKPMDTLIVSYFNIIGDSNFNNFLKILKLKGQLKNESNLEKDKFKYMDMFKLQLRAYQEENDDENSALIESNLYIEKIKLANANNGHSRSSSSYLPTSLLSAASVPVPISPSTQIQSLKAGNTNITNFFNNSKIDTQSILNTRDNFEKNIAKTFADNKMSLNENFKKFFKRGVE